MRAREKTEKKVEVGSERETERRTQQFIIFSKYN